VLIDTHGHFISRQCAERTIQCSMHILSSSTWRRPDSLIDGISVYETRLKMGEFLAEKIRHTLPHLDIDSVIPIPDSSRPSAMELAKRLNLPTARASSRIATSAAPSSCRARCIG